MEETKSRSYKLILAVVCGALSLVLARFAYQVDHMFNLYLFWSFLFPLLISRTLEPQYAFISGIIGVVPVFFIYLPQRGYGDCVLASIYLVWLLFNSMLCLNKRMRYRWYGIYLSFAVIAVVVLLSFSYLYRKAILYNPAPWSVGRFNNWTSDSFITVQCVNIIFTMAMLIAISEVIIELPGARKVFCMPQLNYSEYNYKYAVVTVMLFCVFLLFDSVMDKIYSASNGVHISFLKINTGESMKTSIMVAASSIACKLFMVSKRRDRANMEVIENNRREIEELNYKLENKVMLQTRQLEQAYADLEAYSYTVSHELKTPVREIQAYAEIIQEDNEEILSQQSIEDLQSVRKVCKDTIRLIEAMMEYAKVGYQVLNPEKIDLKQQVYDCFHEIMNSKKDVQVELEVYELGYLTGDRFLIKQMVFNILSNSVKYRNKDSVAHIVVGRMKNEEEVTYYFNDNGVGFKEEYSGKLFQVFDRLHSDTEYEGSGIGLATVKKIVQKHGGSVAIRGQLGRGCTVFVTFPADKCQDSL